MTDHADGAQPHPALEPGDLCHHGQNALPLYRVIWVDDGKAWLRDVNSGSDSVVQLGKCRACSTDEDTLEPAIGPATVEWPDGTPRP